MSISFYHILGIVLSIVLIEVVGVVSSKKVKTADDFNRAGGRAGHVSYYASRNMSIDNAP